MSESKTIGLRMAKASTQDLDAAFALAGILESLGRGYYPSAGESECENAPTHFDSDNMEHLQHLHGLLCNIERTGSLFRVAGGLATLLSEANAIVDPDDDCIALHPRIEAAMAQQPAQSSPAGAMFRNEIERAVQRARVFDDGSDGADAESAQSVVAILGGVLAMLSGERVMPHPDCSAHGCRDRAARGGMKECEAYQCRLARSAPSQLGGG